MVAEGYQEYMYRFIETVLKEIGPRESCSESERRLGRQLADMWSALGHEVRTERFTCHPKAFLGFIPFSVLLYLASVVSYWFAPLTCSVLAGLSFTAIALELLRYREFVDPLFPAAEGENIVGIVRPRGEVRRRVIVSAHQDSAYEFNLWFLLKNAALPIMLIAFAAVLVPLLGGLAKGLAGASANRHAFDVVGYIGLALYPFVGLHLFFHTYVVVPGAMDDLAGIGVVAGVAQALADARQDGAPLLEHTEVRLLATSSEEAGLRGAKRYVRAHNQELIDMPSYGLFIDGVYDERFLGVITRELFTGARHDRQLVQLARDVAATHHWPMSARVVPLGATDAAAFSVEGIPSVCLVCADTSRLTPNYHTRLDTIDHVRPESLGVMLQVVLDMIERIEAQDLPQPRSPAVGHVGLPT